MKRKVNGSHLGLIAPSSKKQKTLDPVTGELILRLLSIHF